MVPKGYLSVGAVSRILGVNPGTTIALARREYLPSPHQIGASWFFLAREVYKHLGIKPEKKIEHQAKKKGLSGGNEAKRKR